MGPRGCVNNSLHSQLILALANTFHKFFEGKLLPQRGKCAQTTRAFTWKSESPYVSGSFSLSLSVVSPFFCPLSLHACSAPSQHHTHHKQLQYEYGLILIIFFHTEINHILNISIHWSISAFHF